MDRLLRTRPGSYPSSPYEGTGSSMTAADRKHESLASKCAETSCEWAMMLGSTGSIATALRSTADLRNASARSVLQTTIAVHAASPGLDTLHESITDMSERTDILSTQ